MTPSADPDERLRAILDSPTYRLAYEDIDLLGQEELRPLRLQLGGLCLQGFGLGMLLKRLGGGGLALGFLSRDFFFRQGKGIADGLGALGIVQGEMIYVLRTDGLGLLPLSAGTIIMAVR